ncbi:TonB-dependent receptor [Bacteroides congonensis]
MDNFYLKKSYRYKCSNNYLILFSFLLILVIHPTNLHAQNKEITLSVKNVSLQEVLDQIENKTIYRFTYRDVNLTKEKKVTITASQMPVETFLNKVLSPMSLTFKRSGNTFAIIPVNQEKEKQLTGVVVDENNSPLIGVSIQVKGIPKGTTTDINGKFTIESSPNTTLVFSYLGYLTQEVKIKSQTSLNIDMTPDTKTLDEVIVVGYGSQKKSDLTGSISTLKGSELPQTGNTTLAQMIKGQIPGISFSQSSTQPGAAVSIQIRGAAAKASPLLVIDGVPVSTMWEPDAGMSFGKGSKESVFDYINPEDIQDIQVLKDASATSIYGSQAAGGVILITTKRGSYDNKIKTSFKTSYTTQWIAEKPKVLDAKDYMRASNDSQLERWMRDEGFYPWGNKIPSENIDEMRKTYEQSGKTWNYQWDEIENFNGGTDWYDVLTRNGGIQQYDFSLTGGGKKNAYLISLGHMSNDGIVKNNDYARTTGRINFDQTFNKWLKAGISASYSIITSNDVALSSSSGATSLFAAARKYDPTIPVRDENGNYALGKIYGLAQNPASILDVAMNTKKDNILTSAFVNITPIDGLAVKTTVGYDRKFASSGTYFPMTTQEGIQQGGGIAKVNNQSLTNKYINITATYNKKFAQSHSLSIMAGWEYRTLASEGLNAANWGFSYDAVKWYNLGLGTAESPSVGSSKSTEQSASFISRLNYAYKDRYLLTANFRRDGSSNFAANKQWGNFGGVSLAWRANEESFLKNIDWLSNLKIRLGAGITGYAGSLIGTQTYYTPGKDYLFNNAPTTGVALAVLGNPNLSWESQQDINIGLDFGLFNNKIGGSIDIYERTIKDRIGTRNLMSYHEVNTVHYNTQRIDKTRGIDVMLYATLMNKNDFSWHTDFTLTYYRDFASKRDLSEILDINQPARNVDWNDVWGYVSDGLVMPGENVPHMPGVYPGAVKIKDLNGYLLDKDGNKVLDADGRPMYLGHPDGKIDNADKVVLYNNTPILVSWTNTFTYKGLDLSIYLYGKFNQHKNNDILSNVDYSPYLGTNTSPAYNDRWWLYNMTATQPAFTQGLTNFGTGDYFLENAWFIRLDNITLGYTLPKKLTKKLLNSLRVYVSAKNLLTITPYKGYDPEYNVYTYPSTSSFTVGIDIKF